MGIWKLQIESENILNNDDDTTVTKEFEVAEYKLPSVNAKLLIEPKIPFNDVKFPVTVEASYVFGKKTFGNAIIKFADFEKIVYEKTITVNSGSASFEVNIINDLKISSAGENHITVKLYYEDSLTGTKVIDTKKIAIISQTYDIHVDKESAFRPGHPIEFTVYVIKYDNTPAPAGQEIQIFPTEQDTFPPQTLTLDKEGKVTTSIILPNMAKEVQIKITTKDSTRFYNFIDVLRQGIKINVLTEK